VILPDDVTVDYKAILAVRGSDKYERRGTVFIAGFESRKGVVLIGENVSVLLCELAPQNGFEKELCM
jgi:hypothetical protein